MDAATGWMLLLISGLVGAPIQESETLVRGIVGLKGPAPVRRKLIPTHDEDKDKILRLYPGGVPFDAVEVNSENRVQRALVFVKAGIEGTRFDPPNGPVHLDFERFRFNQRVLAIRVGQELVIRSNDEAVHNAHVFPRAEGNKETNVVFSEKGKEFKTRFAATETGIKITCDFHPEFGAAWVTVLSHPFSFVTGENGEYRIPGLPPGKYILEAWQDHCAPVNQEIEIRAKETKVLNFELEARK
jgi:hypothetical protein